MTPTVLGLQAALPEDLARKLNELAAERGLSPADVVLRHFAEQAREGVEQAPQSLDELKPRVPPPPGMTAMQFIRGHWPGDETDTDADILADLKAMDASPRLTREQLETELKAWHEPQSLDELRPQVPPPPGMTGLQFVEGKWPGDETDAELLAALKAMD